jgi:hypothetical protein
MNLLSVSGQVGEPVSGQGDPTHSLTHSLTHSAPPVSEQVGERVSGRARTLNPTPFLCRAAVRSFLLEHAEATRAHKFARVSGQTLQEINEEVRLLLMRRVRQLPSKGKTI